VERGGDGQNRECKWKGRKRVREGESMDGRRKKVSRGVGIGWRKGDRKEGEEGERMKGEKREEKKERKWKGRE